MAGGETQVHEPPTKEQLDAFLAEPKALISVYDKIGIGDFAEGINALGIGVVSTGSTAGVIRDAGVPVTEVADITGFPEMLGGRVKTLHPKIHGGILADVTSRNHVSTVLEHKIPFFKVVCVDPYPFEKEVARPGATPAEINELIDIGGPTMLRAAAKARRIVLSHPEQRVPVLEWLWAGCPDEETFLHELAARAFYETARYDSTVARYLGGTSVSGSIVKIHSPVKYGENAWQTPSALHADNREDIDPLGIDQFEYLESLEDGAEKFEKGYVGVTDLDRLLQTSTHIAAGFERNFGKVPPMAVGVKHGNACGAAVGETLEESIEKLVTSEAFVDAAKKMLEGDTRAIFGGVVMINGVIDKAVAETLMRHATDDGKNRLLDGIVAAGFTDEARAVLSRAKLRLVQNPALANLTEDSLDKSPIIHQVRGGQLEQPNYTFVQDYNHEAMVYLGSEPTEQQKRDMILAWAIGCTSNSNTITIVKDGVLIGNGVAQQDRVGAGQVALMRTTIEVATLRDRGRQMDMIIILDKAKLNGASVYSDSFFSHPDAPELLATAGVECFMGSYKTEQHKAILQPLVEQGVKFALMPDELARGFYAHGR